jgi:DNA ligase (NAD+)
LDQGLIQDAADIFELKGGDLIPLERFAQKSAANLLTAIQARREISLPRFIIALGILHVGEETAYLLADEFVSLAKLREAKLEELEAVPDIGPVVAQSIYRWFRQKHNRDLLKRLLKHVTIKRYEPRKKSKLAGKKFVLTGTLESFSRDEAKEKIRELGGEVSGSVSKETDYLVLGREPGSKLEEAKKFGVKIIDEKEFKKLL